MDSLQSQYAVPLYQFTIRGITPFFCVEGKTRKFRPYNLNSASITIFRPRKIALTSFLILPILALLSGPASMTIAVAMQRPCAIAPPQTSPAIDDWPASLLYPTPWNHGPLIQLSDPRDRCVLPKSFLSGREPSGAASPAGARCTQTARRHDLGRAGMTGITAHSYIYVFRRATIIRCRCVAVAP